MLGLVQRIVDAAEEGIGAGIARAVEHAEAQAGGQAQGLLLSLQAVLGQQQAELLAQLPGVLQVDTRHQHAKLLAAQAQEDIALAAEDLAHGVGELAQALVASHVAVLVVDLLEMVDIQCQYGKRQALGDRVLQHLAGLMRDCSRSTDLLCRSGGEEFLMLLPQADAAVAMRVAERLRLSMASMPSPTGTAVTVSLGVALWPGPPTPVAQVLKAADAALYQAKAQGRDRVVYAPTGEDSAAGS